MRNRQRSLFSRLSKPAVFALSLLPVLLLSWQLWHNQLGANPIQAILHSLGLWGLRFLWLTLALTPLSVWCGWTWTARFRRMLGLFAFFYISLHIAFYIAIDQGFDWPGIWEDITRRTYIILGMTGFVLLVPLAATSTKAAMRRLGRSWKRLHRLVYPAAILASIHFWMSVKADWREPAVYAAILGILFLLRLLHTIRKQRRESLSRSPSPQRHQGMLTNTEAGDDA